MEQIFSSACLTLALLVVPIGYLMLCLRMRRAGIARPPYLPFFFIFGSFGGWLLAFGLSPSGVTALSVVFLLTLAPLTLLGSAIWLWRSRTLSPYHRVAFFGSVGYFILVPAYMGFASLVLGSTH